MVQAELREKTARETDRCEFARASRPHLKLWDYQAAKNRIISGLILETPSAELYECHRYRCGHAVFLFHHQGLALSVKAAT